MKYTRIPVVVEAYVPDGNSIDTADFTRWLQMNNVTGFGIQATASGWIVFTHKSVGSGVCSIGPDDVVYISGEKIRVLSREIFFENFKPSSNDD